LIYLSILSLTNLTL